MTPTPLPPGPPLLRQIPGPGHSQSSVKQAPLAQQSGGYRKWPFETPSEFARKTGVRRVFLFLARCARKAFLALARRSGVSSSEPSRMYPIVCSLSVPPEWQQPAFSPAGGLECLASATTATFFTAGSGLTLFSRCRCASPFIHPSPAARAVTSTTALLQAVRCTPRQVGTTGIRGTRRLIPRRCPERPHLQSPALWSAFFLAPTL